MRMVVGVRELGSSKLKQERMYWLGTGREGTAGSSEMFGGQVKRTSHRETRH